MEDAINYQSIKEGIFLFAYKYGKDYPSLWWHASLQEQHTVNKCFSCLAGSSGTTIINAN
jgi:hypothetical protein